MKVTRIEEFKSDIATVWSVVTNNNDFSWRSDIMNEENRATLQGRPKGNGTKEYLVKAIY